MSGKFSTSLPIISYKLLCPVHIFSRHHIRKIILTILYMIFIALISLSAKGQNEAADWELLSPKVRTELERDFRVIILPFGAGDGEVIRTLPIIQSLPDIIAGNLKFLRQRWLPDSEYTGYTADLKNQFPEEKFDPQLVPIQRTITISIQDIESDLYRELYFSALRKYLESETPFPSSLIHKLKEDTKADLFIAGSVQAQNQYIFIDLLTISPYVKSDAGNPSPSHRIFSLSSIGALKESEYYITQELGHDLYNAPAGSVEFKIVSEREDSVRIYIDNTYWGIAPLHAGPLAEGSHRVEIYEGSNMFLSTDIEIDDNKTLEFIIPENERVISPFLLNTTPHGLSIYENGSFLGYTPLFIDYSEQITGMQVSGEGVRSGYIFIDSGEAKTVSINVPSDSINVNERLSKDRRQFYAHLGLTLVVAIIPLILTGVEEDLNAINTNILNADEVQKLNNNISIASSFKMATLGISIVSLANTIGELIDYLKSAELARGILVR